MRIVIDLQGAQSHSQHRGIGRFTLSLAQAIVRNRGKHQVFLALNGLFPDSIEPIRAIFVNLLPQENICVWQSPVPVHQLDEANTWRRRSAELVREAFLASLKPDVVLVCSLFEGLGDNSVTSIGTLSCTVPTAVILYDLIPLIYPQHYLINPQYEACYQRKLDHLHRADLLLAISEASQQDAINHLGFPVEACINISAAAEPYFQQKNIDSQREKDIRQRYGVQRKFVMYAGCFDVRKNIERLIRAYALLPTLLRSEYQLVLVGKIQLNEQITLEKTAKKYGVKAKELVLTGFVSEKDILTLYNLCTVLVFPSWYEGFGLPALEAMACGRAVIGANTSSLPEVIGRNDALFDPFNDSAIDEKLAQVLTDDSFRLALEQHGLTQAKRFSWDSTAQRAIAAMETLHIKQASQSLTYIAPISRPKLAYVSPLPPEQSSISNYRVELLPELARHYVIDVIVAQHSVSNPWIQANYPIRNLECFRTYADHYDRVLYHFGNSLPHKHMFALLEEIPGVVILHDFFLNGVLKAMELSGYQSNAFVKAAYRSHGYKALQESLHNVDRYPCNLEILNNATGVIVHSESSRQLANDWYGLDIANDWWAVIPLPNADRIETCNQLFIKQNLHNYADKYTQEIERLYQIASTEVSALTHMLTSIEPVPVDPNAYLLLANAIGQSIPPKLRVRQLFVDISELIQRDARSGVQRVTRSILHELLSNPPAGYRVEPVYAESDGKGYRYARNYTLNMLNCSDAYLGNDDVIDFYNGDLFLGLDLQHDVVLAHQWFYQQIHNYGVLLYFVVYDLLPIYFPYFWPRQTNIDKMHDQWLEIITTIADGTVCISQAVASELTEWLKTSSTRRLRPLKIDWFHLGADIDASLPSKGMASDAKETLHLLNTDKNFLMVSTLEPRKGHTQTLKAFEQLWAQGITVNLVIVGKQGWMVEALVEKLRHHPKLGKQLFWLEGVSDEYLEKLYDAASCLIAASEGEGFGLPLIEAAQHKLPIIARDIPIFREVAGDHAYYFNGLEPSDLAQAIQQWLKLDLEHRAPSSEHMPWLTWAESTQQLLAKILPKSVFVKKK